MLSLLLSCVVFHLLHMLYTLYIAIGVSSLWIYCDTVQDKADTVMIKAIKFFVNI